MPASSSLTSLKKQLKNVPRRYRLPTPHAARLALLPLLHLPPFHLFTLTKLNFMLAKPTKPPQTPLQPQLPRPPPPQLWHANPPHLALHLVRRELIFSSRRVKANSAAQKINLLRFSIVQLNKQTYSVCALIKMKRRGQTSFNIFALRLGLRLWLRLRLPGLALRHDATLHSAPPALHVKTFGQLCRSYLC